MPLAAGTRLGPYEILSPLGAGGMGEVYRAKDTRLDRAVAVKVLPSHLSDDAELKARFEREARAISRLTHPNICTLHDVGSAEGVEYLVMELLEGQTLAERLEKGPLPVDQVLKFGVEIADALDKAHRAGIVHRDLKPGNVMLTKSGVKVLDFGLAKAVGSRTELSDLSSLPTEAERPLTERGTILGTFQYMAPEQLEGKEADARTDIFALGCVLYEMASGTKAFSGTSRASLIGAIMNMEPPSISSVQPLTPPALDHVVARCLAKDQDRRWQSAADVASELEWIAQTGSRSGAPAPLTSRRPRLERLTWAGAFIVSAGVAAFFALRTPKPFGAFNQAVQFKIPLPESVAYADVEPIATKFALSPDGSELAMLGATASGIQILVRKVGAVGLQAIPGTEGAASPFWSPDGNDLAFFAEGKLKRISLSGGPVITIADAPNGSAGSWSPNGTILFSSWGIGNHGIRRVAASGGLVTDATKIEPARHEAHFWPTFLPDGKHFLYVADPGSEKTQIRIGELGSWTTRFVARSDSRIEFSPTGHLLFAREGALFAQAFDPGAGALHGDAFPVASEIRTYAPTGAADFSVASRAPVLAFQEQIRSRLRWISRSGNEQGTVRPDGPFYPPRISRAGDRLVFAQEDPRLGTGDIWIQDLRLGTTSRATFEPTSEWSPVWLPDGNRVIYASDAGGELPDLYWLDPSSGKIGVLLHTRGVKWPEDVSPDGRFLLYSEVVSKQPLIWVLPLVGERKPHPYLNEPFPEYSPRFSPDGQHVAYVAEQSGRAEIYVRPFPGPGQTFQVSRNGGRKPCWSRDGREIFFVTEHELMSAEVRSGRQFETSTPVPLFGADLYSLSDDAGYEVGADGRFLVLQPASGTHDSGIHVVANWLSGFQK